MAQIVQIDENTWRIEDDFVRFFLLAGTMKAALIDSGVNSPNAKEIAETLTDLPIMLINTHGDGDHVSGTGAFDEIHMHIADYVNCKVGDRFPDTELVALKDGDRIPLGERTLEIITIPGHTKGSVAILDERKRVLYSGDSVQDGSIYMFGKHRDPEQFEASLNKLKGFENRFDVIYPSHSTPELEKNFVDKVISSWKQVKNGEAKCEDMDLYGNPIKAYTAKYCGFYCER